MLTLGALLKNLLDFKQIHFAHLELYPPVLKKFSILYFSRIQCVFQIDVAEVG